MAKKLKSPKKATKELSPTPNHIESYIGMICLYAGKQLPYGWVRCDGQKLDVDEYSANLYSVLGTLYGGIDDISFKLPNLNASIPAGGPIYIICVDGKLPR
jgi:microcystin-dependent protein